MKQRSLFVIVFKIILALLGIAAIIQQITTLSERGLTLINLLSYFTIESNIFNVVMLLFSALWLYRARPVGQLGSMLRGGVVVYMAVTGIIFWTLLADFPDGYIPWNDLVLHTWLPIAAIIDWMLDTPATKLYFRRVWLWLIYPLLYVGYSLVSGMIGGWYPYDFLDPATNGYRGIIIMVTEVMALGIVIGLVVIWWTRVKQRRAVR